MVVIQHDGEPWSDWRITTVVHGTMPGIQSATKVWQVQRRVLKHA